jgi:hypothetical protein
MDWLVDPQAWIAFLTLVALEIVLGVDNIIFISILAGKLPASQQKRARNVGLALALVMRVILLFSLSWVIALTGARAEFLIADRSHVACRSFRRAHSKRLHLLCYGIFCVRRDAQSGAAKKIGAGFVARSIRGGYSPTDLIGQINAVRVNLSS